MTHQIIRSGISLRRYWANISCKPSRTSANVRSPPSCGGRPRFEPVRFGKAAITDRSRSLTASEVANTDATSASSTTATLFWPNDAAKRFGRLGRSQTGIHFAFREQRLPILYTNTASASSKETPCLTRFLSALAGSHSKTGPIVSAYHNRTRVLSLSGQLYRDEPWRALLARGVGSHRALDSGPVSGGIVGAENANA